MFRLRNAVTSNFIVQVLHLLRVKGLYFFSSPSRNKENTEDFKKYLMNVSHKSSEFRPPFLGNKGKTKVAQSQNMCATPIDTFLRKLEQISEILLISLKSGWSDLKRIVCAPDENSKGH